MKAAAQVMIDRPGAMTAKGRLAIVAWLRRTATDLKRLGAKYNDRGRFRARYMYRD